MGCLILIVIFVAVVSNAWWLLLAVVLAVFLHGWHQAAREDAARRRARARERRLSEARLTQRIAGTKREIARSDADLGLGSAPLSAVNADSLERLANHGS